VDDEPRDIALLKERRVDSRKGSINISLPRSGSIKTFLGRTHTQTGPVTFENHCSRCALRRTGMFRAPMTRSDLALCVFARL
jgi:hypothetical protein